MTKPLPGLKTDVEAKAFVETADLSGYDLSTMAPMKFELRRKDKTISLRLPEALLERVRLGAEQAGMPTQRFIRMARRAAVRSEGGARQDRPRKLRKNGPVLGGVARSPT